MAGRTATRALIAVGAYVAQDLRDADGLTRPLLRRAALRLVLSPQAQLRQLGSAYLRLDPPTTDEAPARTSAAGRPPVSRLGLPAPGGGGSASASRAV